MRRLFLAPVGCLTLSALASVAAAGDGASEPAQYVTARVQELPASPKVPRYTPAPEVLLRGQYDIEIEPASTSADLAESFRYNLEKLDVTGYADYGGDRFLDHSGAIIWDVAAVYGLTTVLGLSSWDWSINSFRFESEGWFGDDTRYGGMDKLGHAYSGYLLTEYFTQRIAHTSEANSSAVISGASPARKPG